MTREYTNKLLELMDEGIISYKAIIEELVCYFSEDEIKEFCLEGFAGEIRDLFKGVKE